jgi:hypothetical protein
MKKLTSNFLKKAMLASFLAVAFAAPATAQEAPPKLQAALIMKLLAFYTNLGDKPFSMYVLGADPVAEQLKGLVGQKAGKATLNSLDSGDSIPGDKYDVIYVGKDVADAIAYSQSNKSLSVTGKNGFVNDGVTLGIGIESNKPKILLNLSSSKAEDINWNPAILKVAATIQ